MKKKHIAIDSVITPTTNNTIIHDGSDWITADYIDSLEKLNNVDVQTISPVNGDSLVFKDGTWIPSTPSLSLEYSNSLPVASSNYRGKILIVEGGIGVSDELYICKKLANETYNWIQIG
ncbi:hypothetical protein D3C87_80130 [compost metagenome]